MKSKMTLFWFVVSLSLGAALAVQWNQRRKEQRRLEAAQLQVEEMAAQTRTSSNEVRELQKAQTALRGELVAAQSDLSPGLAATKPAASAGRAPSVTAGNASVPNESSANGAGGVGNFLSNMMKDPETRKAMQEQQRMGLNMIYGSFFKQLQLTPDQEKKLKDILLDQQMANVSNAGALMDSGANRAEAMQKITEQQKDREQQMKEVLGDEKFAQLQDYNQTLGERMMLEQFGRDAEITPEQKEQLLGIVLEEKKNMQINLGAEALNSNKDPQSVIGSPELMEKMIAQQRQVNERVLERAGTVLTPDQVRKLGPLLDSQIEMQRAGAKMAQQMFGGSASSEPSK